MPGIYMHIPFCRTKCNYCDFYSITSLKLKESFIEAIIKEINLQKTYLPSEQIETIYLGGGTPSILNNKEINTIYEAIQKKFRLSKQVEFTMEVNPDDINEEYIENLKQMPVNRISLGIQSFNNNLLKFLNRRHNAQQAINAIEIIKNAGYNNISIDLIYGIPGMTIKEWEKTLLKAIELDVQHISAYHLTIESDTLLAKYLKDGLIKETREEQSYAQFKLMVEMLEKAGFEHYEISNFAKKGFYSKHNTSYWFNKPYLGIGPSAHSYNLNSRQWNIRNVEEYINKINSGILPYEKEILSENDKFNDYILTRLRTRQGIDLNEIKQNFGEKIHEYCEEVYKNQVKPELINITANKIQLTVEGMFVSDYVIGKFMLE